jgi:hypothetical protein
LDANGHDSAKATPQIFIQMNQAFPDCGSGACQKLNLQVYDNATIVEYVNKNIAGRISPGPAFIKI